MKTPKRPSKTRVNAGHGTHRITAIAKPGKPSRVQVKTGFQPITMGSAGGTRAQGSVTTPQMARSEHRAGDVDYSWKLRTAGVGRTGKRMF